MDLICWIRGLFNSFISTIKTGSVTNIGGHVYETKEIHENVTVIISECACCKKLNISWADKEMAEQIKRNEIT